MSAQTQQDPSDPIMAGEIVAYLTRYPDFFERYPELLELLRVPHPVRGAVSLLEHQIENFRRKNTRLESRLAELMRNARDNEALALRMHHLALNLVHARGLNEVLEGVREQLLQGFKVDRAVVRLFRAVPKEMVAAPLDLDACQQHFPRLMLTRRSICGRLTTEQMHFLFGDASEDLVTAAVIPLAAGEPMGVLALGSVDAERFAAGIGTLFLGQLGDLIAAAIAMHLDRHADG
ncbi:MAG: DUF484 family protein [Thiotrichales bacterium]